MLANQKQMNIQKFLNDVDSKKQTFINQKKRKFDEESFDFGAMNIESDRKARMSRLQSNISTQSQSDDRDKYNIGKDAPVELQPEDFSNKERNTWFSMFQTYTKTVMHEEEAKLGQNAL